jgi:hypothetical protein
MSTDGLTYLKFTITSHRSIPILSHGFACGWLAPLTQLKGKDLGSSWLDWTLLSAMKAIT